MIGRKFQGIRLAGLYWIPSLILSLNSRVKRIRHMRTPKNHQEMDTFPDGMVWYGMVWYGMVWHHQDNCHAQLRPAFSKTERSKWFHQSVAHPENDRTSSHSHMTQVFHWSPCVLANSIVLVLENCNGKNQNTPSACAFLLFPPRVKKAI